MRVDANGRVTIPADIRERAGLLPDTEVEFRYDGAHVLLFPARADPQPGRGDRLVAHLLGRATSGLSTDEIMAMTRGED